MKDCFVWMTCNNLNFKWKFPEYLFAAQVTMLFFSHQGNIPLLTNVFLTAFLRDRVLSLIGNKAVRLYENDAFVSQSVSFSETTFRVLRTVLEPVPCCTVVGRSHHLSMYHLYTSCTRKILLILPS